MLLTGPVLVAAALIVFVAMRLIPGDPVEVMMGERATAAEISRVRARLGLDLPWPVQFLRFLRRAAVGDFGRFLGKNPGLGISLLADDSEFRDSAKAHFERNREAVRAEWIRYAAFVTVEGIGNSGVSDETRKWAFRTLDEVLLMSYFSCELEGQKEWLDQLLSYADSTRKKGFVRIAILMGSKKTGKEVSCEKLLGSEEAQRFLRELHAWALERHPSYGGIVLETDKRFPAYDVAPRPW